MSTTATPIPAPAIRREAWEPPPALQAPEQVPAPRATAGGQPSWPPAPLAHGEVDLWTVPLPLSPVCEATLAPMLTPGELHRALRFGTAASRHQFVAGRGVLRWLLGHYLGTQPGSIGLTVGAKGKPALADACGLRFNLSHTDGLLVVALARDMDVGVDVERIRPIDGAPTLAARYFTARERAGMADGPEAFLRLWTCRESAVKAAGTGISAGWEAIRLVERNRDEADAVGLGQDCHVRLFTPRPGYVAAVAALSNAFRIRHLDALDPTRFAFAGASQ